MTDGCIDELPHSPDGFFHPEEARCASNAVPDIELFDLGDGRDRLDVPVGEAVAGVDGEAGGAGMRGGAAQRDEGAVALAPRVGVAAGVELDGGHRERMRPVDRGAVGADEETHPDTGVSQAANRVADSRVTGT